MSCSCELEKSSSKGGISLSEKKLGKTKTHLFSDFLLIPLSKKWIAVNDGNSLEFEAKLIEGQLVLCAKLTRLQRTKEVSKNEI